MAAQTDLWLITSVEALDELTGTGLWRGNIALIDDIFNRWLQICDLPDNQNVAFTATPDFWAEVYRLYDPGTPRNDEEDGGDESADSQQQDDSLLAALNDEERGQLDEWLQNPFGAPAAAEAAGNDSWDPTEGELDEIDRLVEQIGAGDHQLDHFFELSAAHFTDIRRFALRG
ncbi:MAG: hypothetical protein GY835_09570 [bacterium]|nr:hypothetical protein [bacterium]